MSTGPSLAGLQRETEQADELLFGLATQLKRLPFDRRTQSLHIRALDLKRVVAQWTVCTPSDAERRATCERIAALYREATQCLPPDR